MQQILEKVGMKLPKLYDLNAGPLFKYIVLICLEKMISFSEIEDLRKYLDLQLICIFLSKLTRGNDIMATAITLLIIDNVIVKFPEIYISLTREGIIDYVKNISSPEEVVKLEAYSIIQKKYNSLESLRQVTNSFARLSQAKDFLSQLSQIEAESQKLEALINQMKSMREFDQAPFMSNTKPTSQPKIQSTLSSMSEENSNKSTTIHSLQNIPKSESIEQKLITGLNKKQPLAEEDFIDEEDDADYEDIANEKSPATQFQPQTTVTQPVDKLTELRKEVAAFAIGVYARINEILEKNKSNHKIATSIVSKLEEISEAFEKGQANSNEFGQSCFEKYINLLSEHGRITTHEIMSSRIFSNLLKFLFDNVSAPKPSTAMVEENATVKQTGSIGKPKNKFREEETKWSPRSDTKDEIKDPKDEKPTIELSEQQCRTILGRIIAFLYYFKKPKTREAKEIFMQDLLKNLHEMINNSDKFSVDVARTYTEYEVSLNSGIPKPFLSNNYLDLRFLSQRIKFKAQFIPTELKATSPSVTPEKKKLLSPNLSKQKSTKIEEEKYMFPGASDTQMELYMYKDAMFKELPLLVLSVEQFGTLEVIEDYLLNKLNSKEDVLGGIYSGRNDYLKEKIESSQDNASEEDDSSGEGSGKKNSVNKVPVNKYKFSSLLFICLVLRQNLQARFP